MCYHVCGMTHIKEPLLLISKSSPCSGNSSFPRAFAHGVMGYRIDPSHYLSGPLPYI